MAKQRSFGSHYPGAAMFRRCLLFCCTCQCTRDKTVRCSFRITPPGFLLGFYSWNANCPAPSGLSGEPLKRLSNCPCGSAGRQAGRAERDGAGHQPDTGGWGGCATGCRGGGGGHGRRLVPPPTAAAAAAAGARRHGEGAAAAAAASSAAAAAKAAAAHAAASDAAAGGRAGSAAGD